MKPTEIIEALREKLTVPGGRHLYGVLGTYSQLDGFAKKLHEAKTTDGDSFPKPVNVNRGILDAIPDDEFKPLAENEAKRPEPTAAHVTRAFERFLRANLAGLSAPQPRQAGDYTLPTNLIAENHLWEIREE